MRILCTTDNPCRCVHLVRMDVKSHTYITCLLGKGQELDHFSRRRSASITTNSTYKALLMAETGDSSSSVGQILPSANIYRKLLAPSTAIFATVYRKPVTPNKTPQLGRAWHVCNLRWTQLQFLVIVVVMHCPHAPQNLVMIKTSTVAVARWILWH